MSEYHNRLRHSRIGAVDSAVDGLYHRSEGLERSWEVLREGVEGLEQQRLVLEEEKTLFAVSSFGYIELHCINVRLSY